tara:strand:+ start:482 stop:781 length:300 start_codon:yes stop_codon:yes gene_type:complete
MQLLYEMKPISIFTVENDARIRVQFCNIKMKMKRCQFRHFHKYLSSMIKKIDYSTESVELLVVKDSCNIIISLNHFLQLCKAVDAVMETNFGIKKSYPN